MAILVILYMCIGMIAIWGFKIHSYLKIPKSLCILLFETSMFISAGLAMPATWWVAAIWFFNVVMSLHIYFIEKGPMIAWAEVCDN